MFVEGGPSGDCPSLERRRERRGAADGASAGSAAGFVAFFSVLGSEMDDALRV